MEPFASFYLQRPLLGEQRLLLSEVLSSQTECYAGGALLRFLPTLSNCIRRTKHFMQAFNQKLAWGAIIRQAAECRTALERLLRRTP